MKKHIYAGALIIVIFASALIAQKAYMKLADARANDIYANTVAQVAKSLPSRSSVQRIVNTPEEKKFLNIWVKQEYKGETFTDQTLSGTFLVMHDHKMDREGNFIVEDGKDIHELYLKTPTEIYKVENISYPALESLNGIDVSLTGLVSSKENDKGQKTFVVNIPGEKVKTLKLKVAGPIRDWAPAGDRGGSCGGNYCALVILVDNTQNSSILPSSQEIHDYIFNGRIKDVFYEQSFGQMNYAGDVTDWIETSEVAGIGSFPTEVSQYLLDNSINLNNYDQIMYLINDGGSSGNYGSVGKMTYLTINSSQYEIAMAQVNFWIYSENNNLIYSNGHMSGFDQVYIHETGHNLGVHHDNSIACEHGPTSLPSECKIVEYGNRYSIMGSGYLAGHFSAIKKIIIGWLSMDDLVFLSSAGDTQINPIEVIGTQIAAIDIDSDFIPEYILENRSKIGIDKPLFKSKNYKADTALVYTVGPYFDNEANNPESWDNGRVNLVDVTPAQTSSGSGASQIDATLNTLSSFANIFGTNSISTGNNSSTGYIVDEPRGIKIGATKNSSGGLVSLLNTVLDQSCNFRPIKVFRYEGQPHFSNQLPEQKWPQTPSDPPAQIPHFAVDVTDPSSYIDLAVIYKFFNDDSIHCPPTSVYSNVQFNGMEVDDTTQVVNPWTENIGAMGPYVSVYGLPYGQHTITFNVLKENDGSQATFDFIFQLDPL